MKIALDEVTRFATLLTRSPSIEDLLISLKRDFLSEEIAALQKALLKKK